MLFLWLAALASLLAACEGPTPLERHVDRFLRESGQGLLGPVGEVQNLSFPDQAGLVHVVVRNIEGDVRVRGRREDASGPTTVRLRPRATVDTNFAARNELDQVQWDAQMKDGPGGSRVLELSLRTRDPKAWFLRCDIEIDTPRLGRVDVVTDHGRVLAEDNRGGVQLKSTFGDVRVRTPWPITEPCRIEAKDGDVEWIMRGESSGAFDCECIGGKVHMYARYGHWVAADPRNDHNSLVGRLNGGENPVVIRVLEGSLYIRIVEDPHDTGTFISPF